MKDFVVPQVEEQVPALEEKEASRKAFYAAATAGEDPVANYEQAKGELMLTGKSAFIEMAETAWQQEQNPAIKSTVSQIIADPTISPLEKKSILSGYALTGFISTDLKDKYIQKVASRQIGNAVSDVEAQDIVVDMLNSREQDRIVQERVQTAREYVNTILDKDTKASIRQSIIATGAVLSDIVMAFPAAIGKIYTLVKDKDVDKAKALEEKIKTWAFDPDEAGAQQKREAILQDLAKLGALGERAAEQEKAMLLKEGVAPWKAELLAMKTSVLEDPFTYIGVGIAARNVGPRGMPEVAPDAPATVTNVANPQAAEKLGSSAIMDQTGKIAEAIGTDRGSIIHDWVLPKPLPDRDQKMHPDLMQEINRLDAEMRDVFQDYRYDPNVIQATKREQEVARTLQILNEHRTPYYQQANSTILETDELFTGKAIFGRNSSSGYVKESTAQNAFSKLQESINRLPEDERGTLSLVKEDSQYYIQWDWKKEYDDLSARVFGPDSIQTSMLGVDVSGLARSSVGRWLFPTGWLPKWTEAGAARAVERAARTEDKLLNLYRDKIISTPFGKELTNLIDEAESIGKDYFSKSEISSKFPHLSTKDVDSLFETHTYWRRIQDYNYNFLNREQRNRLASQDMQGLYDNLGNYIGAATEQVSPSQKASIRAVWNFDFDNALEYTPQLATRQDKKIVRLDSPLVVDGQKFNYGLLGAKQKLGILPTETLPRIAGYSPRKVKEHFYVDVTPTSLKVDGNLITDPKALRNHSMTKAAARTQQEANDLVKEYQDMYPDHVVTSRPERQANYGQVLTDYKVHDEMFRHAMKRGERLPSNSGYARIEDRLLTAVNTAKTLARMNATRAWDDAVQAAFVKGFQQFLRNGEFPQFKTDIRPLENMNKTEKAAFDTAHRIWDWYARQKSFETMGDFIWSKSLHRIADVLEKFRIPAALLRDLATKGNLAVKYPKMAATVAYIHLAPVRQWIMQPAQLMELYAINPHTAVQSFQTMLAVRVALGSEARSVRKYGKIFSFLASKFNKLGTGLPEAEFNITVKAIRDSGVLQSVDMNSLVHGVFKEVDRGLVETGVESIAKTTAAIGKAPIRAARTVGFDAAEITNRIGIWIQTKEMWKQKYPERKWTDKESLEEISTEAWRISGSMSRPGNLPYQEGALSVLFQFAAISQKLLFNLLQDNATIMTPAQRARLAATRLSLYGVKYGVPAGSAIYYFVDRSEDPELKQNAELIKRGLVDYTTNRLIAANVEPDTPTDLAVSKMMTPYSEGFLPYYDVLTDLWKWAVLDEKSSKPRYPALSVMSGFGKAVEDMKGWWTTREVNEEAFNKMAWEAAELASGLNGYAQGQLMLGLQDKVSKHGNKYGMQTSKFEAYAKMFAGISTQKEEDMWKIVTLAGDAKKEKKEMASRIHQQLMNQRHKIGENDWEVYGHRLNSFISLLDPKYFTEQDKFDVMEEIVRLDRNSYTSVKASIFADFYKRTGDQMTQDRMMILDIMKRSQDPKTQEFVKIYEEGKL